MRICSLLPSATEIVFALGLGDQLVGVTHECDYPAAATRLPAVTRSVIDHNGASSHDIHRHVIESLHGGSSIYTLDQGLLEKLNPDLILTQELCQVCAVSYGEVQRAVRLLPGQRRVLSLEPTSLDGILDTIGQVGAIAGAPERAEAVRADLRRRIERVASQTGHLARRPRVFAMEWLDPPFTGGHWVPEMVKLAGGVDGLGRAGYPSRQISWSEIAACDPDFVVLMPCGYDLEKTLKDLRQASFPQEWGALRAVRSGRVFAVDGSAYFNRPGPRIVDGLEVLAEILHPQIFPRHKPMQAWRQVSARR